LHYDLNTAPSETNSLNLNSLGDDHNLISGGNNSYFDEKTIEQNNAMVKNYSDSMIFKNEVIQI
jgi:hypothetical protein